MALLNFFILITCIGYISSFPYNSAKPQVTTLQTLHVILSPPFLKEPKDNAIIQSKAKIQFQWSEISYAASYTICYFDKDDIEKECFATDKPSFKLPSVLRPGNYKWMVFALTTLGNPGEISKSFAFQVVDDQGVSVDKAKFLNLLKVEDDITEDTEKDFDNDSFPAPTLESPEDKATIKTYVEFEFEWSEIEGAAGYTIHLLNEDGTEIQAVHTEDTSIEAALEDAGNYKWKVNAKDKDGIPGEDSEIFSLEIVDDSGEDGGDVTTEDPDVTGEPEDSDEDYDDGDSDDDDDDDMLRK